MKALLEKASTIMKPAGYRKERSRFWKTEGGIYKLVDFQAGAFGSYFFVNVGIHPLGLPQLQTGRLIILERPKEYECIVRQRIEQIVLPDATKQFPEGLVSTNDVANVEEILSYLPTHVEPWLSLRGSFAWLAHAPEADLDRMITVVPVLRTKAIAMLRFFCYAKMGELAESQRFLNEYLAASCAGYDFSHVDRYLQSLFPTDVLVQEVSTTE